ncbi:MAG: M15 family metallopeptidase [Nannocystaceae bacterium]
MIGRAYAASALALALACTAVAPEPASALRVDPPRVEGDAPLAPPIDRAIEATPPDRLARGEAPADPSSAPPPEPPPPPAGSSDASTIADAIDPVACDRRCEGGDQPGDDPLTLLDRDHGLLPGWEPADLVALDPPYVIAEGSPPNLVRREAAAAFVALSDAAFAATGVRVNIRSGYRPFALQCGIFKAEVARGGCVEATRSSARAGFSEHQLGTTVDVAIGWRRLDGAAPIDAYLRDHAHEHGWVLSYPEGAEAITGYKHEPWHFRYLGPAAARAQIAAATAERRITTEEYLRGRRGAPRRSTPAAE